MCKGCRYKKCLDIGLNSKYIHERASASNALNNSVQGQQGERQTLSQATLTTQSNRKRKEAPNMNQVNTPVPQPQIDLRQLLGQVKTNISQPLIETLPISSDQDSQDEFRNVTQIGQTSRPLSLSAILAAEQNNSINNQPVQQQAGQTPQTPNQLTGLNLQAALNFQSQLATHQTYPVMLTNEKINRCSGSSGQGNSSATCSSSAVSSLGINCDDLNVGSSHSNNGHGSGHASGSTTSATSAISVTSNSNISSSECGNGNLNLTNYVPLPKLLKIPNKCCRICQQPEISQTSQNFKSNLSRAFNGKLSCNKCQEFFITTVQLNKIKNCVYNQNCDIYFRNVEESQKCHFCWYLKCLGLHMNPDMVQIAQTHPEEPEEITLERLEPELTEPEEFPSSETLLQEGEHAEHDEIDPINVLSSSNVENQQNQPLPKKQRLIINQEIKATPERPNINDTYKTNPMEQLLSAISSIERGSGGSGTSRQ